MTTLPLRDCNRYYYKAQSATLQHIKIAIILLDYECVILPLRLSVKESTGRMDVDNLTVHQCPITLLAIFLCSIPEEATEDSFLDPRCIFATRYNIQFVPTFQNKAYESSNCPYLRHICLPYLV